MTFSRSRRIAVITASSLSFFLVGLAPVSAHVEASAEGAQAGTGPVTVSFLAEGESSTAGIVGVKVQLPAGIPPDTVSLASGPTGWTLAATQDGYEVSGPGIGAGVDLEYGIAIAMLPRDSTELPFKTLVRYSDGEEDAWIELPNTAAPDPEFPAPTITVAPAPPAATTPAPSSPAAGSDAAGPTSEPDEPSPADPDEVAAESEASSARLVTAAAVVAAVVLAGALWAWRRRAARR